MKKRDSDEFPSLFDFFILKEIRESDEKKFIQIQEEFFKNLFKIKDNIKRDFIVLVRFIIVLIKIDNSYDTKTDVNFILDDQQLKDLNNAFFENPTLIIDLFKEFEAIKVDLLDLSEEGSLLEKLTAWLKIFFSEVIYCVSNKDFSEFKKMKLEDQWDFIKETVIGKTRNISSFVPEEYHLEFIEDVIITEFYKYIPRKDAWGFIEDVITNFEKITPTELKEFNQIIPKLKTEKPSSEFSKIYLNCAQAKIILLAKDNLSNITEQEFFEYIETIERSIYEFDILLDFANTCIEKINPKNNQEQNISLEERIFSVLKKKKGFDNLYLKSKELRLCKNNTVSKIKTDLENLRQKIQLCKSAIKAKNRRRSIFSLEVEDTEKLELPVSEKIYSFISGLCTYEETSSQEKILTLTQGEVRVILKNTSELPRTCRETLVSFCSLPAFLEIFSCKKTMKSSESLELTFVKTIGGSGYTLDCSRVYSCPQGDTVYKETDSYPSSG